MTDLAAVMAKAGNHSPPRRRRPRSLRCGLRDYDGFWERNLQAWDIAAGIIMIKEAGGFVADADGGDEILTKGSICAGNEVIHRDLC